ncbi:hypothetical protein JCM17843_08530 [Kordiimonadales bacterium JCM 17843]|nr:hypothetical protein JCM17843_08530 [Kordiimonadales bacterium JCM 17843]
MTKLRGGLIQMGLKASTDKDPETIRKAMIEAHIPLIEEAGEKGVQVLCFQEVFTQPYFCPSQDTKWYDAAEAIPDGPTTKLMQDYAKKYEMVIVVPIYEADEVTGVYYNTAAVIDATAPILGNIARPISRRFPVFGKNSSSSPVHPIGRSLKPVIASWAFIFAMIAISPKAGGRWR